MAWNSERHVINDIHLSGVSMKRLGIWLCLCLFLPASFSLASTPTDESRTWEHETSDIRANSRIRFGSLSNGLRFAWLDNAEPDQRCYMRLRVGVGSLHEEEHEQGLAHFLEHMLFNGTRHFPPGTMIEWFQKQGMDFGADSNAVTSFESTIYMLNLPTSDEQTVSEGLKVFRDFADGALLQPKEIQDEKGVVDAEERERDSAGLRTLVQTLNILYDGTRLPKRIPIGKKEVRDAFNVETVKAFYEKWYRPDNMTLIIVGDLEQLNPEALVAKYFDDFQRPNAPLPKSPPLGEPNFQQRFFAIHEEEITTAQLSLDVLRLWQEEPDDKATRIKYLPLSFARRMLNLRYSELAKKEDAAFISAGVGSSAAFRAVEGEGMFVSADPAKWKEALASAEKELRRAIEHGFRSSEFEEVKASYLRSLDEAVEREKTRSSSSFANELLDAASARVVASDAATNREIMRGAVEGLTIEQCHQMFRKHWNDGVTTLSLVGSVDLGGQAPRILQQALDESRKAPVEAPEDVQVAAFAYASKAQRKGEIGQRRHVEDLDVHLVQFANGVRVNIKKTDFKEKQILIQGRLGEGLLTLAPEQSALALVASQAFTGMGLEAHSADELRRLNAGKRVAVTFGVGQDHFVLGGGTTSEDLLLQCELMAAYLTHPGWRQEGMRQFKAILPRIFQGLKHQHAGPLQTDFLRELYSGDPRFGIRPESEYQALTPDDVRKWLDPHLKEAPLEVTFVGDLDVEATVQAAARTLGQLPKRREVRDYTERRRVDGPKSGIQRDYQIETSIPKTLVYLSFPTTDGLTAETRRSLSFLSRVVNDRLRVEIREKLGAAYSPSAVSDSSRTFPGVGSMGMQSMADPEKAQELKQAFLAVAEALSKDGVTEEETERLRQPLLAQLRDQRRQNSFWLSVLGQSQSRPATLDDNRSLVGFYETIQAAQLSELAKKYLKPERVSWAVISPKPKEGESGGG